MLLSFLAFLGYFDQSTDGFWKWSAFGVGVLAGPSLPGVSCLNGSPCLVLGLAPAFVVLGEDLAESPQSYRQSDL